MRTSLIKLGSFPRILLGNCVFGAVLTLAFVTMYQDLESNSNALARQKSAIAELDRYSAATDAFNRMRYWLTDFSLGWQDEARDRAHDSRKQLELILQELDTIPLEKRQNLTELTRSYQKTMSAAVVAYIDDERLQGNRFSSVARETALVITDELANLLHQAHQSALFASEEVTRSNRRLQSMIVVLVVLAILAGVGVGIFSFREQAQRSRTEESSRKAAELARLITEAPNEIYIMNRDDLRFEEVNHGAEKSSKYERNELLAMSWADLDTTMPPQSMRELIAPLDREEVSVIDFKTSIKRKDGVSYSIQVSLHAAIYNGTPVYLAFATDLTHIEKLERQLSQAQKLESIGQLAAGVAHEINTPMQFIGDNIGYLLDSSEKLFRVVEGYHELLSAKETSKSWAARIEEMDRLRSKCRFDRLRKQIPAALEESREGVTRVVKIVRAMKEFSHPGAKEMKPKNLNALVESTVAISRSRWKNAAELELDLDPNLPEAPMLASEINQVLLNLMVNAGDAIADKNEENPNSLGRIAVRTWSNEEHVIVEVGDDGCGMPKEVSQKIFDPFFTTKDVGKGTGQGLSISHNVIVNMHDGVIEVDSAVGMGTKFRVKIPRNVVAMTADAACEDLMHC